MAAKLPIRRRPNLLSQWAGGKNLVAAMAVFTLAGCASVGLADRGEQPVAELSDAAAPTYIDLVEWSRAADTVVVATITEQIAYPAERAPDVAPGMVRLYVEAATQSLLTAPRAVPPELVFLIDLPRGADGNAPSLEGRAFLLFGDLSTRQAGGIQLLSPDSMVPAGPRIEGRVREVLTQLASAGAPAAVTGIRDVISVPGNLAGESETQMFLETADGAPVSLTVIRRPGMAPQWGVSAGEIVDAAARPPAAETLAWYRLACTLPDTLPAGSFLQRDAAAQDQARLDYRYVRGELGACERRFG